MTGGKTTWHFPRTPSTHHSVNRARVICSNMSNNVWHMPGRMVRTDRPPRQRSFVFLFCCALLSVWWKMGFACRAVVNGPENWQPPENFHPLASDMGYVGDWWTHCWDSLFTPDPPDDDDVLSIWVGSEKRISSSNPRAVGLVVLDLFPFSWAFPPILFFRRYN